MFGRFPTGILGILSGFISPNDLVKFIILKSEPKTSKELSRTPLKLEGRLKLEG